MDSKKLKDFLDDKVEQYNNVFFIKDDPVSIPHLFSKKQDIEIAGFFAAIFSWGNRTTIIQKTKELMQRMDMSPYEFCKNYGRKDVKRLKGFKHRTFTEDDLFYFVEFFRHHYQTSNTLETAFIKNVKNTFPAGGGVVGNSLIGFKRYFFSLEHLKRTEKHISSPVKKSTCKRLNMFLRWMVRKDKSGVDLGIWSKK